MQRRAAAAKAVALAKCKSFRGHGGKFFPPGRFGIAASFLKWTASSALFLFHRFLDDGILST
ncbi:MAG: hypothetical protein IJ599_01080 [Alphaproteobacteria bacterium]|nr:hypothetical protein [Alphaproteobacteria bacterium]